MMKILILTRCSGYNVGSSLQAYAMQQILCKLGVDNLIINYDESFHNLRWKIRPIAESIFYATIRFLPFKKNRLYKKLYIRSSQRQIFHDFDASFLKKTRKKCRTSQDLRKVIRGVYACICGSDQIWSPILNDKNYFLPFVKDNTIKRIAYAPSLGISEDNQLPLQYSELVSRFDSISARETNGCEILSRLTGRKVELVLDPTLLLTSNDWNILTKPATSLPKSNYILCYFLGNHNVPTQFICNLSKLTGCEVYIIQAYNHVCKVEYKWNELYNIGPCEFIHLVSNAAYICTDSFHGTIFSINFHKRFFAFSRFEGDIAAGQNSRIASILEILNLMSCHKTNESTIDKEDLLPTKFDDKLIDDYRSKSINYLKTALS